nr:hypothetical protein [Mesorhizobium sp.]
MSFDIWRPPQNTPIIDGISAGPKGHYQLLICKFSKKKVFLSVTIYTPADSKAHNHKITLRRLNAQQTNLENGSSAAGQPPPWMLAPPFAQRITGQPDGEDKGACTVLVQQLSQLTYVNIDGPRADVVL